MEGIGTTPWKEFQKKAQIGVMFHGRTVAKPLERENENKMATLQACCEGGCGREQQQLLPQTSSTKRLLPKFQTENIGISSHVFRCGTKGF